MCEGREGKGEVTLAKGKGDLDGQGDHGGWVALFRDMKKKAVAEVMSSVYWTAPASSSSPAVSRSPTHLPTRYSNLTRAATGNKSGWLIEEPWSRSSPGQQGETDAKGVASWFSLVSGVLN